MVEVEFERIEGRSTSFYIAMILLAALGVGGVVATYLMYAHGLYLSGMTNRVPWGLQIAMAIFYIGLSAGSLVVSGLYGIFGKLEYKPFARIAAYLAMLFLIAGLLSILTDQGRVDRVFVKPFTYFNLRSMFSINPSLYTGHILICIIYLWALFKEKGHLTKVASLTVCLWAIGTHTGTGAIFAFVPRELYNSPLLPPSFVAAALSSGAALMILVIVGLFRMTKRPLDDDLIIWLGRRLLAVFLVCALYVMLIENVHRIYLVGSREAGLYFLFGGFHSILFWVGLIGVGSIVPALLLFIRRTGTSISWIVVASGLVVVGVLCERFLIVVPGLTHPPELFPGMEIVSNVTQEGVVQYSIGFLELLQALGVLGIIGFFFLLGLKLMKFALVEARSSLADTAAATAAYIDVRFKEQDTQHADEFRPSFADINGKLSSTRRELRRTREYLEGIVENSADIIITVDPNGFIKSFNTGAEKILGYKRDEVIGKKVEMLFSDPRERDAAIARLEYTDHVVNYETHFLTKSGQVRDVILTLSRLRRRDGTPIGTFGISKDVTREKRLQQQLLQSEKMAVLGQALTGIQHAVKNLLNVLKGGSYMVKTGLAKGDRNLLHEGWQMVQEGIDHMTELSTSMLNYAREQKVKPSRVDLKDLLQRIHNLSLPRFQEKGVDLQLEVSDVPESVKWDVELIHSVIMDLLSNALDACLSKTFPDATAPRVDLRVRRAATPGSLYLEVVDNGEGMTEEVRARVFTPFFSTKKRRGTGMGLAQAARVVSSHGGRIEVESSPGQGSIFRIQLPVEEASVEEASDPSSVPTVK